MELTTLARSMSNRLRYVFGGDLSLTHPLLHRLKALPRHRGKLLEGVEARTDKLLEVLPHELTSGAHLSKDKRQGRELLGITTRYIRQLAHISRNLASFNAKREHLLCTRGKLHSVKGGACCKVSNLTEHLVCKLSIADKRLECDTRLLGLHPDF